MLTAKHVLYKTNDSWEIISENTGLLVFLNQNTNETPVKVISLDSMKNEWYKYIAHKNASIDLAMIPIRLELEKDDVKLIDIGNFSLELETLYETNDIFCSSYQPNISTLSTDGNIKPIIRKGSIARINTDKTYYIDSAVFPWNSWSPVFLLPSAIQYTSWGISLWWDVNWWKFIWIVNSYVPYLDIAQSTQTWRNRIIFEENTWLSKISSVDLIKEIISQGDFQEQEKSILKK